MLPRKIAGLLIGLLLVLLSAGCQSYGEKKQADQLESTLRNYETTIRWGMVEQAYGFRSPEAQEQSLPAIPKDLRVTNYDVIQGPSMVGQDKALQLVRIQYVFESDQILRELLDHQVWGYDANEKGWVLRSDLPKFH